ncbi:MAG: L-threonylcarbamoyladenylate synthase [Candidatus Binataceae bacterium]
MTGALTHSIAEAVEALRAGEPVVYPTETFYGVGADALSPAALERLFALKRREAGKPVALIAADIEMAFALAREIPDAARRLAEAFWPGPLTLVMPPRAGLPEPLAGPDGGVGVRVSSHPVARELAARLGRPITATSANLSGDPPATTLDETRAAFGDRIRIYLEGGRLGASAPSTVIAFDRGEWRVLRTGAISHAAIAAALSVGGLK